MRVHTTSLGRYTIAPDTFGKSVWKRAFSTGSVIESRDGKTTYRVNENGSFIDINKKPKQTKKQKRHAKNHQP